MKLLYSTTSPYARLVRIALAEKGVSDVEYALTDPWQDKAELIEANPSARVPALVLQNGLALTDSLLILMWLETVYPRHSLLGEDASTTLSRTGVAMGAIDAAAAIIIGRKALATFDESPVGLRRRRSIIQALSSLESNPPVWRGSEPCLAAIATIVLLDYIRFRFSGTDWVPKTPSLDALAAQLQGRASFQSTRPREMPVA